MSYILDALTRSEQERNRGSVPDLHTVQAPAPRAEGPVTPRTGYLVAGVLLAAAGATAGWLQTHGATRGESVPVQIEPIALRQPQVLPAVATPSMPAPPDASVEKQSPLPVQVAPKATIEKPAPALATARAAVAAPQPAPRSPARSREERVPPPSELPAAVQKELPPLEIYGFADSRETGRMAVINGRVVVEGDEVAGLTVETIAPGALTLRYKDQRFRRTY